MIDTLTDEVKGDFIFCYTKTITKLCPVSWVKESTTEMYKEALIIKKLKKIIFFDVEKGAVVRILFLLYIKNVSNTQWKRHLRKSCNSVFRLQLQIVENQCQVPHPDLTSECSLILIGQVVNFETN